ncbi:GNAT family N-acetyltransferase [Vibrio japonicus]|uniref:GNAT family N-acetyltransferase n=1 Tax=Vibrio japonicus TaxID=1824638 RepID=A0ABY5LN80_9VIBR|nr:GNAT family N-acetyltransferase [Vibrio japonicus]UUM32891.1 GNAT family N-acetyltransferase [Vibrio japonicus]
MKKRQRDSIQCEIYYNPDKSWLKQAWCDLEQRSKPSFFLSWLWIGTWLDCFVGEFSVIEARQNSKTVGLGILVKQPTHLFFIPFKGKYYLHRTGNPVHDQIWIEYNDFLMDAGEEDLIRVAMVECLVYGVNKPDAIVIGASDEKKFGYIEHLGLKKRTVWETKNYALNLDDLREKNQSVLQFLSRNSRYQILRSMRKYSDLGEITLEKASSAEKAKEMLKIAKPLHLARWSAEHVKSGFSNEDFVAFHELLIERGIETGAVEVYHIKAGTETLSIMYNFKHDNHVYFYLCAINYQRTSSQYKPGLVSHYLLINKALEEGVASYDFMGGTARYKETFSNTKGKLSVNQYEHSSSLLMMEDVFRSAKLWVMNKKKSVLRGVSQAGDSYGEWVRKSTSRS